MSFEAPVGEIAETMRAAGGLDEALATGAFGDLSPDTVTAILAEAGRFAEGVLAPLNRVGDRDGVRHDENGVTTASGWKQAYRQWVAGGWNGLGAPTEWGGQGLPVTVQVAVQELWNAGNASFAIGPMLTAGAIDAIAAHADDTLKRRYLPRLVSGEWMATMNLTEPQAGSDLGAIRTRAEPQADGSYRIFGQKIFITYGEHDLTENIVHLVLARLPEAPAGTRGISLFLVPKLLADGARNDVVAAGVERKLGIHGAPTCTMVYGGAGDGAVGWRIGAENHGLAAMFTMMNMARLSVGVQGVGVAEGAYQTALAYARGRRQGHPPAGPRGAMVPIVEHPDVQRDLLAMKALTAGGRAICHACAHAIDMSRSGPAGERARWASRAALLTPIAKAFATDAAIAVASTGVQVHGGAGYIEETGAAQYLRDARVFAIYEGTNGIQAIDLVTRKLTLDDGSAIAAVIADIGKAAADVAALNSDSFGDTGVRLAAAAADLAAATRHLGAALAEGRADDALAGATPYLRLAALAFGGALLAKGALAATDGGRWVALARFFAETFVGETSGLAATVVTGADGLRQAAAAMLTVDGPAARAASNRTKLDSGGTAWSTM